MKLIILFLARNCLLSWHFPNFFVTPFLAITRVFDLTGAGLWGVGEKQ